ncbi:helix-turn-helix domain-containing protein [uncultured Desulfovibrio sp.]|uniref:helix-turn-helix domain-containing protein n=1 Tax=uncultured Desulfovibrio sp. TaxID=167968 RepID=UPI0026091E67|nr:helix-turn-helix domain-containing protein [uncultured Desulfovibrio sp.]
MKSAIPALHGQQRVPVCRAAELLGCSPSYVYKLISRGELEALRIGTRKGLQVTLAGIRRYLAKRRDG